ncbi:hypothetical protein FACS189442_2530 [Spirochaetia bacterium]|nr:hypothetical protein FACS189442_2530 [Spirochaetia bacterium]
MTNALNEKDYVEYLMGHTNRSDMSQNYLHLGSVGNKYIEDNGKKVIDVIENYFRDLFPKNLDRINWKYTPKDIDKPIIKEVVYNDGVHSRGGKKYLIYTISDPEKIDDITDYDNKDYKESEIDFRDEETEDPIDFVPPKT